MFVQSKAVKGDTQVHVKCHLAYPLCHDTLHIIVIAYHNYKPVCSVTGTVLALIGCFPGGGDCRSTSKVTHVVDHDSILSKVHSSAGRVYLKHMVSWQAALPHVL